MKSVYRGSDIEYATRYAAEYSAVLFVGAGSPADLRRNLAALSKADVLNLPERETSDEEIQVAAVLWQTSFDRLTAPARRLLERLAWLGPEPIPESEAEPDPRSALVDLATYSLVTRSDDTPPRRGRAADAPGARDRS